MRHGRYLQLCVSDGVSKVTGHSGTGLIMVVNIVKTYLYIQTYPVACSF